MQYSSVENEKLEGAERTYLLGFIINEKFKWEHKLE